METKIKNYLSLNNNNNNNYISPQHNNNTTIINEHKIKLFEAITKQ